VVGQGSEAVGGAFEVGVNGVPVTAEDRRLRKSCTHSWDVGSLPNGNVVDADTGWTVSGWIGIVEKSSQTERGVDVFARGKVVELDTMFSLETTHIQFARAYVVGEIQADFLDAEDDHISTARNSVHWDSEAGRTLQEWGQAALKYVFAQWREARVKEKEERVVQTPDFARWLKTRRPREKRIALRLVRIIVSDEDIAPESAGPLLDIIKTSIEFQAFQELVDEIGKPGANAQTLLRLFDDWQVVEAREHLKLSDGRLEVMDKLYRFLKEGALEVQQIQPLFQDNGWLVNPSWGDVTGQTRYTDLLRKHCREPGRTPEKDRRIDILGYDAGGGVQVVELKRPEKTLSWKDLDQIEEYVRWARSELMSTGPDALRFVSGLLIVGKLSSDNKVCAKQVSLAGEDIRVETFDDLLRRADTIYREVERRLKEIAPEYSREARRQRRGTAGS
jgi:hypothetical protein